jgi:regulation of enolase protein 1 (concanavalin A-like superfamily)
LTDPKGDCPSSVNNGVLSIAVPAKNHSLCAETGEMDAPRFLNPISGDFIAQVRIAGNVSHRGKTTSSRFGAYHGAGLLAWQDARTYLRFERAAVIRSDGQALHYANLELRREAKVVSSVGLRIPDQDTFLRLERRGVLTYALVSTDGYRWTSLEPLDAGLTRDIQLGVVAINTSTEPLNVIFTGLEVFKSQARRPTP